MKIRNSVSAGLTAASVLWAGMAMGQSPVHYVYAPVVDVEPVYRTEQVPVEREVCWQERGYRHSRGGSATGTIAGAIVGGVIGNQFGGGSGRKALTVAGAALGASVGHDAGKSHRRGGPVSYERCEVQVDYESRSYTSGYRVQYEYQGEIYQTRTRSRPGEVIRLEVAARPVG
ncbi:MAG: glycine zipper 2TM domain-containing protein [Wenzhouxiangellaceae bacterium]|nr:glycine zipper 2TM domain-containing protein [Wenzhouxiangellaceae bacterium]